MKYLFAVFIYLVPGLHVGDEVNDTVGVTHFIIIPWEEIGLINRFSLKKIFTMRQALQMSWRAEFQPWHRIWKICHHPRSQWRQGPHQCNPECP